MNKNNAQYLSLKNCMLKWCGYVKMAEWRNSQRQSYGRTTAIKKKM